MKKVFFTLVLFWMSTSMLKAQENVILWQADTVKINGLADEWLYNMKYYDEETQFHYGISNDEKNLYLCFFTANQTMQMKVFRSGMTVELKTKGKPKRDAKILYPKKDTTTFQMRSRPNSENANPDQQQQRQPQSGQGRNFLKRFLENNPTFITEGFVSLNGIYPLENENGISVAINWDEKRRMAYEIVIPLKELYGDNFDLNSVAESEIKLKVNIDAMEMPTNMGQRPSGGHQGGNMQQGGAQGQNTSGPSQQDRALLFVDQTLDYNFVLSKK